ncbi:MAG: sensor domain-containing diguanylate cyclase [Desulfuromonadales bacterium]
MVALSGTSVKLIDPRDLLDILRQHPLTSPFNLTLYSEQNGRKGLHQAIREVCAPFDDAIRCISSCLQGWEDALSQALLTSQPVVRKCEQGLVCFIIPLPEHRGLPECLIGGGMIEGEPQNSDHAEAIDLEAGGSAGENSFFNTLLSLSQADAIAEEIARALPRLIDQQVLALSLARTTQRLEAVQKLSRDLAGCEDCDQAIALVSESLVVLFDLPGVLIVLQQPGQPMKIQSSLGVDPATFRLDQKRLVAHLEQSSGQSHSISEAELAVFFPGLAARSARLFPLVESDNHPGVVAVLDIDLHSRDQALIDLLVKAMATRLEQLNTAEEYRQEKQFSERLVSMITRLSLIDNRQDLYLQMIEMSADLLTASSGSLMLLDETDGTLKIVASKGMTEALAKTMSVPYGEGISGRVARSGFPMLVNDIERDQRVALKNRPRFKTKSFVSLPLELDGRLIGVLNLADKSNCTSFTETDLGLVQTFIQHAVLMIDRAATLEKAGQLEQLAITDPLTGLYNRRFLENRLQEEFSRSERQQQNFCIILTDLDNFKIYNDICGHLAGDNALRKTANLMRRSARDMDIVTRYGGEEFCLILPGTGKKESVLVGERIRRAIEAESFPGESHLPLGRLTISLGVATYPDDGVSAEDLIHAADQALYRAKDLGRNRLVLYEPSPASQALLPH